MKAKRESESARVRRLEGGLEQMEANLHRHEGRLDGLEENQNCLAGHMNQHCETFARAERAVANTRQRAEVVADSLSRLEWCFIALCFGLAYFLHTGAEE